VALKNRTAYAATAVGWVLALAGTGAGQMNAPLPAGCSMADHGTIVYEGGMAGRQPWTSAAFLADSLRFGFAAAGTDFYDRMDNFNDRWIAHAAAGGWAVFPHVSVKASYQHFTVLSVYREQAGFVSAATDLVPFVRIGAEVTGVRAGLTQAEGARTAGELGCILYVPRRFGSVSLQISHLTIKRAGADGFGQSPSYRVGFHSARNSFGAQGFVFEHVLEEKPVFRFLFGEQYWLCDWAGFSAGISTAPFMVGFGVQVDLPHAGCAMSLVHHPVLGWSKGVMGEWRR